VVAARGGRALLPAQNDLALARKLAIDASREPRLRGPMPPHLHDGLIAYAARPCARLQRHRRGGGWWFSSIPSWRLTPRIVRDASRCQTLHDLCIVLAALVNRGVGRQLRESVLVHVKRYGRASRLAAAAYGPVVFDRNGRAHVHPHPHHPPRAAIRHPRERLDHLALTVLTMHLISGALRTKDPLPYYMPDTMMSLRRLVYGLRDHVGAQQAHERLPLVYYLATISAMEEVSAELLRLAGLTRDLVGVDAMFRPAPSNANLPHII